MCSHQIRLLFLCAAVLSLSSAGPKRTSYKALSSQPMSVNPILRMPEFRKPVDVDDETMQIKPIPRVPVFKEPIGKDEMGDTGKSINKDEDEPKRKPIDSNEEEATRKPIPESEKEAIGAVFAALTRTIFAEVLKELTTAVLKGMCYVAKFVDTSFSERTLNNLPVLGYSNKLGALDCEKVIFPKPLLKIWEDLRKVQS